MNPPANGASGSKKKAKPVHKNFIHPRKQKRQTELQELETLEKRCQELAEVDASSFQKFKELPLSEKTLSGLSKSSFVELTDIQRMGIPLALRGLDVLGAAKTGSGKTLAFVIPVLETLYRAKWTQMDGLGALIISPTRELAVQIFQILRKVGSEHSFSAGLIIGGKDLTSEQERVNRMNILVCTPGRLLQHMDQTVGFDCPNLQILVLDEADRCLDLGFSKALNAIIENLPPKRQTLLFSATQTKSVRDLARLTLNDPEYVAVHEKSEASTPQGLIQHYLVTPLEDKLDVLWSFLKTHLTSKGIAFVSSCKQVRFIFESFCKLHPGVPLLHIHGKQKQSKRVEMFNKFSAIRYGFIFATDIAARGLDFPAVDWVVQVDCPDDADTYIHRVGRTARYGSEGRALLILLPSEEEAMVENLKKKKIPIEKIKMRKAKSLSVKQQLQALCFQDPELKYIGQKAFVSYMRSVYLQKDKKVFDVHALPAEKFAESLGLPGAPKIKFVKKSALKNLPHAPVSFRAEASSDGDSDPGKVSETTANKTPTTKIDKMFKRQNQTVLTDHYSKLIDQSESKSLFNAGDDDEGDFISIKRRDHSLEDGPTEEDISKGLKGKDAKSLTHKELLKLRRKALKEKKNEKLIFDDDGETHPLYELEDLDSFNRAGPATEQTQAYVEEETTRMIGADVEDRRTDKEKRRAKKLERKNRARMEAGGENVEVYLRGEDEDEIDGGEENNAVEASDTEGESRSSSTWKKRRREDETVEELEEMDRNQRAKPQPPNLETLEDEEALALKLLGM